jgi:aryl-alcohol dehydrogenase
VKLTAAVLEEVGGGLRLREAEVAEPAEGEVLVRLAATGICHTDLLASTGDIPVPLPIIPGHEGSGVVEAVGPGVTRLAPGDHVVLTSDTCGDCRQCRRGRPTYCEHFMELNFGFVRSGGDTGYRMDGAPLHGFYAGQTSFATYTLVRERVAVPVRKDVPLGILGMFGCGVQTGAGAVINALRPQPGSSIAIFGAGAVGLSAIAAAKAVGCTTVIAVDVHAHRLDLARELGATHAVQAPDDVVARIREATDGFGADYALDLTGVPAVMADAVTSLGRRGTCGLIGIPGPEDRLPLHIRDVMDNGKSVVGMVQGDAVPDDFIPALIELHRGGLLPVERLVTTFPFERIDEAYAAAGKGEVVKAIVEIDPALCR